MPRTDIHRPSAIIPADYVFVEFEYLGEDVPASIMMRRERIQAHMMRTGGTYSHHAHGGNCHICGARCIDTALFHHIPSNVYIRTGLDCCDKLDSSVDGTEFRTSMLRWNELRAGKRKAQGYLTRRGLEAAWSVYETLTSPNDRYEENTIRDIISKLVQYGSLSDRQIAFVGNLLTKITQRASIDATRAAETAAAQPVPVTEDRIKIVGQIVSVRPGEFGTRIIVKTDAGWVAMGSKPSSIDAERGKRIEFAAKIKVSDRDPKFGFFSRPTQARILEGVA